MIYILFKRNALHSNFFGYPFNTFISTNAYKCIYSAPILIRIHSGTLHLQCIYIIAPKYVNLGTTSWAAVRTGIQQVH